MTPLQVAQHRLRAGLHASLQAEIEDPEGQALAALQAALDRIASLTGAHDAADEMILAHWRDRHVHG